ncbi:glycosyltransferase family 4 protein [Turicibacter bilis]|uniref:Glycosyltransferase family 4 protein n=1 Tax=Turicibacter bilis TaxID=2735723 RepID=A0ABY5JKP1_9FIRM|nr:glycosyltransferase family 4 protein [Turicibacter bilis]MBS3200933.1 glycosyltransferase family 4 protein [Turicibacter bilis]UUF07110.1 glycosyltransferase family 4 protein [Turicibacter bilis]
MIKVLHLLPMNKLSGAERMGLLICKHMSEVESYVITGGADLAAVFEKEGIQTNHLNFSMRQLPQVIKQLNRFIREKQIDIIHAHDNIASLSAYLTKKRYGLKVKIVSHIHNCYPWLEGNGVYKRIDQFIRPKYDFNIACGQIVYDYYYQHAPYFNLKKTCILSNAIDVSNLGITPQNQVNEIREIFNIPSDQKIIGYIGRLSEQKGMIPFIKALKNYKDQFENCKFLIVGSGEQEDETKQLVKEFELEELFIFTGFQSNIYPFYQLIDIFFLPSLYEGLPMVLLEAMAFRKAVVSMNVGSINEIIKDDITGKLVKPKAYSEFIKCLYNIKEDETILQKYGNNARMLIEGNNDIKAYVKKIISIYDKVINL